MEERVAGRVIEDTPLYSHSDIEVAVELLKSSIVPSPTLFLIVESREFTSVLPKELSTVILYEVFLFGEKFARVSLVGQISSFK